ncbi:MAG: penicillin-binding protein 2 [Actinomycetota bacterium]
MAARVRSSVRLLCLLGALLACSCVVAGKLFLLQIRDSHRMSALAAEQRLRTVALPAHRGSILASDSSELAISLDMQTIFASPRFIADPGAAAAAIAPILKMNPERLAAKLSGDSGFVYVARKVEPAVAEKVRALDITGIEFMAEQKRFYPSGVLAGQVLGFVGDDNRGLAGLEMKYDHLLQGNPGKVVMERDPGGRPIPSGRSSVRDAVGGQDLVLTIDKQIQFEAQAALDRAIQAWGARGGTIVVMDPRNGDILAMANAPSFDPNDLKTSTARDRKNRAVTDVYEPGSVSKLITAAAALESGVTNPSEVLRVADHLKIGAKTFKDSHHHPVENLSFAQVIQLSSNVGTIKVAERLGKTRLHDYLVRFGYGRVTGLGFPGESAGILARPEKWWATSLGTISIGQGVAVTPLQMVQAYATVANDGVEAKPRLVQAVVGPEGDRQAAGLAAPRRVIQKETARQLTEILVGVTEGDDGTGKAAAIPGYRVAGKTGTAQKPLQGAAGYAGYVASFVGFAPADDPRLVVGVILDDPTPFLAGSTAAVTFKEVMGFSLRRVGAQVEVGRLVEGAPLGAAARN